MSRITFLPADNTGSTTASPPGKHQRERTTIQIDRPKEAGGRIEGSNGSITRPIINHLNGPHSSLSAAAIVSSMGMFLAWWHVSILLESGDAPITPLLGTGVLLVTSVLLVLAGGWLALGVAPSESVLVTVGWVVIVTATFGTLGILVSFHLEFMLGGFDGGPLVADLITLGAAIGFLLGVYDARGRRYSVAMNEERDRFASLFDNLPNPAVHYRLEDEAAAILAANDVFVDVFAGETAAVGDNSLGEIVTPDGEVSEALLRHDSSQARVAANSEKRRMTADGLRDFQVITVPYRGKEGFAIWIDVTERKLQLRRLEVLNRVLRHDLRTDASIISGHADLLPDSPEAETIRARALAMAERGATARRLEQALGDSADRRPVDLPSMVRAKTTDIDGATVHTALQEATVIGSTALGMAIDELLENAIEHNDTDAPVVWISINGRESDTDDRFVTLEIADNGPGLPEMERNVFDAGSETPLQHSSGLGLWLARWVVTDLGGEITVNDRKPCGTVVKLRLPSAESDGPVRNENDMI